MKTNALSRDVFIDGCEALSQRALEGAAAGQSRAKLVVCKALMALVALCALFLAAVCVVALTPAFGDNENVAFAAQEWEGERGPEYPAIDDEFAVDPGALRTLPTVTVTLSDPVSGKTTTMTTATGAIDLPTPEQCGFSAPSGATFVGWSTSQAGNVNVYAAGQMFPDNASHTAALTRDTTVYAVWLNPGSSEGVNRAFFYIRTDGVIPFEPNGYSPSGYLPAGSGKALSGELNWPVGVTNNVSVVKMNLKSAPTDEAIQQVMSQAGKTFDPLTQEVVWYVVKARSNGAANTWNVDGVIVNKASHLVMYHPNGGDSSVPPSTSHMEGQTVTVNSAIVPARWGYDFVGWSEDPQATAPTYPSGESGSFVMPANDVVLYAVWRPSLVLVNYVPQPTAFGTVSVTSNSVVALTAEGVSGSVATAGPGKLFEGWYVGDQLVTDSSDLSASVAKLNLNTLRNVVLPTTFVARFADSQPALSLEKAIVNAPANGEYFTLGETIEFRLTVTNSGNVALKNVVIDDSLATLDEVGYLDPGQSQQLSYEYTVTSNDVAAGVVRNAAVARGVVASQATHGVASPPASDAALAKETPADSSYVVYGAYPAAGGSVDVEYSLMDPNTAEGLTAVTAQAKQGYSFNGWYRYDGTLVSEDAVLQPQVVKDSLDGDGAQQRAPYGPALFLAYFEPQTEAGPGSGSGTPDDEGKPDDSGNSDNPGQNPGGTGTPGKDEGGTAGSSVTKPGTSNTKPTYHTMSKNHLSSASSSSMPRTGDDTWPLLPIVGLLAITSAAVSLVAYRRIS